MIRTDINIMVSWCMKQDIIIRIGGQYEKKKKREKREYMKEPILNAPCYYEFKYIYFFRKRKIKRIWNEVDMFPL